MSGQRWLADLRYGARHPLARLGLWASGAGFVLAIVSSLLWWPVQQAHDQLNDDISLKRRELVQAQQADDLIRVYARAQKEVPTIEKKLEQAVSQAQLVQNLARLARQHGVRIVSETYEPGKGVGEQASLISELTVQGSYPALRDFLRDLPTLPTWTEVQEVRLEAARGAVEIKGRIRTVTFRRSAAGEAARS